MRKAYGSEIGVTLLVAAIVMAYSYWGSFILAKGL